MYVQVDHILEILRADAKHVRIVVHFVLGPLLIIVLHVLLDLFWIILHVPAIVLRDWLLINGVYAMKGRFIKDYYSLLPYLHLWHNDSLLYLWLFYTNLLYPILNIKKEDM